jgi:hypothetical protein
MNSHPSTWIDFMEMQLQQNLVDRQLTFMTISGGVLPSEPSRNVDSKGVRFFAVEFGSYDVQSGRTGLEGITASANPLCSTSCGDFSTFYWLGREIDDAITGLLGRYPGAQIVLLAHSRGGLAARAFLQTPSSSPNKAAVTGLLTVGTPHKGSRLATLYGFLQTDLATWGARVQGVTRIETPTWNTVDFLRQARNCNVFWQSPLFLDTRVPTVGDLFGASREMIALNHSIQDLPTTVKYASLAFGGADLGILARRQDPLFDPDYSVFDRPGLNDECDQVTSTAATAILGTGATPTTYAGDGIVEGGSQRYDDIFGFPGTPLGNGNVHAYVATTLGILHTKETREQALILERLKTLVPWWN